MVDFLRFLSTGRVFANRVDGNINSRNVENRTRKGLAE
jgi:hypothetical protein